MWSLAELLTAHKRSTENKYGSQPRQSPCGGAAGLTGLGQA